MEGVGIEGMDGWSGRKSGKHVAVEAGARDAAVHLFHEVADMPFDGSAGLKCHTHARRRSM